MEEGHLALVLTARVARLGRVRPSRLNSGRQQTVPPSASLDGFVDSDREHLGIAIPEGVEVEQ